MKFLLDANLSPLIVPHVVAAGHEAVHVREIGLRAASDEEIMDFADSEDFVLVSQDSDFTNLLFYRQAVSPSVILLRDVQAVSAADIAGVVIANLEQIHTALTDGAVVAMVRDRVRVRRLPIR